MSPQEAARIICLVHTRSLDFRPIIGVIPDIAKTDVDLYEEASRALRRFGGLDQQRTSD
jgi:hypothetical protein